jgi:hypothetical protein
VIGASIFPPRPGRGYRFHSLQVEIIEVPSQLRKLLAFLSIHLVQEDYFSLESEHVTAKKSVSKIVLN